MKKEDSPTTVEGHVNSMTTRIERLELRNQAAPTSVGTIAVYVQPNEPTGAAIGALWFDTDASCT